MYYPLILKISIFVYNFYSGANFCGEKICGNFILLEPIFADRGKKQQKSQKLEPAKI